MHSNVTHLIFWGSFSTDYINTIQTFFQNVATDSGASTNVYAADPQYTDSSPAPGNAAAYNSTYGGSWNDTGTAIPPVGNCGNQYSGTGVTGLTGCVLDSDLQKEVLNAMSHNTGWAPGMTNLYFVFTPKNVGSCSDSTSRECAFTSYCAYHWDFSTSGGSVIYTNQPYTDTTGIGAGYAGVCDSGQQPNGNWADETINVASHEHNESVTDPLVNAWYDAQGNEDGDKCAWNFGAAIGGSSGAQYNQVIGSGHYYLQQEWNNASSGCVPNTTPPPPAPTVSGFDPPSALPGATVTISGAHFTGATSVTFNSISASFTFKDDDDLTATVPTNAKSGPISVTTSAGTGTSSASFTVQTPPSPDFTIDVSPAGQTVARGSSTSYTVTIARLNGFTGQVRLAVSGLPGGSGSATGMFSSSMLNNPATTSTLTITTRGRTRTGTSTFPVTGTSGTLRHMANAAVTVQ
jgi:hypothetical protein